MMVTYILECGQGSLPLPAFLAGAHSCAVANRILRALVEKSAKQEKRMFPLLASTAGAKASLAVTAFLASTSTGGAKAFAVSATSSHPAEKGPFFLIQPDPPPPGLLHVRFRLQTSEPRRQSFRMPPASSASEPSWKNLKLTEARSLERLGANMSYA